MTDPPPELAEQMRQAALKTRIYAAYLAGRSAREVETKLIGHPDGLTSTGMALLHALRQGEKTITEISRFLPVAPSTLVPVVDALEARGLVRRGHDPRDRRRTPLAITDRGRAALSAVPPMTGYADIAAAMARMGADKGSQLALLLGELVAQMSGDDVTAGVDAAVASGRTGSTNGVGGQAATAQGGAANESEGGSEEQR